MEVHPPEHGIHTWRDFFVHIGTICVGLLIAIGLEQSVEALHHHRELVELRKAMREDAEKNKREALNFNLEQQGYIRWIDERVAQVQTALFQHKPLAAAPPLPKRIEENYPADPSWQAAKASGVLSFMPDEEIKVYTEVSHWIGLVEPEVRDFSMAHRKRLGFEAGFCESTCGEKSFADATPEELREYLTLLKEERSSLTWDNTSIHAVYGIASALLEGEHDLTAIQKAEDREMPGDK